MKAIIPGGFTYRKIGGKYQPQNGKGEFIGEPVDAPLSYEDYQKATAKKAPAKSAK